MIELYAEEKIFEKDGEVITYNQVYVKQGSVCIPIKPVFKTDKKALLLVVGKEE